MTIEPSTTPTIEIDGSDLRFELVDRMLADLGIPVVESNGDVVLSASGRPGAIDLGPYEGEAVSWARSGAMFLTGPASGPVHVAPGRSATTMEALACLIEATSTMLGESVRIDGPRLLGERAATAHFARRGEVTVGGAGHMMRAADGHVAVNLARPEDVDLVPAWLEADIDPTNWSSVVAAVERLPEATLVERASRLGLPAAAVGSNRPIADLPWQIEWEGPRRERSAVPLIVDLSALWAGPLAASIMGDAGCRVVKVEAPQRPDGARRGPRSFYDLLNAGKESVTVDLAEPAQRRLFDSLLEAADVVVSSWRPRVLDNWGIDRRVVTDRGGIWLSITAYGPGDWANRPGFGDDAAVAGGLVIDGSPPLFVGDAIADPIAGLAGAAAVLGALAGSRGATIEVALERAANFAAQPTAPGGGVAHNGFTWVVAARGRRHDVLAPGARDSRGSAAELGIHSNAILDEFGP